MAAAACLFSIMDKWTEGCSASGWHLISYPRVVYTFLIEGIIHLDFRRDWMLIVRQRFAKWDLKEWTLFGSKG